MSDEQNRKIDPPAQHQSHQPGTETEMTPRPQSDAKTYRGSEKLKGKAAIVTGGDSGIGKSAAIAFAKEGADVAIVYLDEQRRCGRNQIPHRTGRRSALLFSGDLGDENFCKNVIEKTVGEFGKLDILVNNAGEQHPQNSLEDITAEQLEKTFRTNIFSMFYLTKYALKHLKAGSSIINTTSITAYQGNPKLIDYSSTKGAILSFTRALSNSIVEKGIRVNAVAPGPIWTPLIPATFSADEVDKFGQNSPMKRPGQPEELAPAYVYLASDDSSYVSGQTIHINGGTVVNG